jgi:hypothetical protein
VVLLLTKPRRLIICESTIEAATWVELLGWRALQQPERRANTYLIDGEEEGPHLPIVPLERDISVISLKISMEDCGGS